MIATNSLQMPTPPQVSTEDLNLPVHARSLGSRFLGLQPSPIDEAGRYGSIPLPMYPSESLHSHMQCAPPPQAPTPWCTWVDEAAPAPAPAPWGTWADEAKYTTLGKQVLRDSPSCTPPASPSPSPTRRGDWQWHVNSLGTDNVIPCRDEAASSDEDKSNTVQELGLSHTEQDAGKLLCFFANSGRLKRKRSHGSINQV